MWIDIDEPLVEFSESPGPWPRSFRAILGSAVNCAKDILVRSVKVETIRAGFHNLTFTAMLHARRLIFTLIGFHFRLDAQIRKIQQFQGTGMHGLVYAARGYTVLLGRNLQRRCPFASLIPGCVQAFSEIVSELYFRKYLVSDGACHEEYVVEPTGQYTSLDMN